jgi:hypothetical protein
MTVDKRIKRFSILFMLLVFAKFSSGQKTELDFNAYSGLFSFRGNGSTSNSWITAYTPGTPGNFTINPYGNKSDFSYTLELQGKRISGRKNIYGLGLSFETLKSKVGIDTVDGGDLIYFKKGANGKTVLKNTFITLNPFVGHRYSYHRVSFDLLAGVDVAFCLKSREVGQATTSDKEDIRAENDMAKPSIDFRPRIQIKTQMNKLGFLAGYSLGLTDYRVPNHLKAYSSLFRLGLSYQLK